MYDSSDPKFVPCLDHGFVYLVEHMGTDSSITQAARISYGEGTKSVREDRGLIRYLFRHRHCYHPSMEVLTIEGWKRWDACSSDETFLVPDPASRTYRAERLKVLSFDVAQEQMFTYQSDRMSYCVTSDHKMWFKGKYQHSFSKVPVQDKSNWGWFDPLTGYSFKLEETIGDGDDRFRFIGFFLGDGCGVSANRVCFHLKKERKRKYLVELLERLNIEYSTTASVTHGDAGTVFYVTIPGFLREWVNPELRSYEKTLLQSVAMLTPNEALGLFDGLTNSDGSIGSDRNRITFCSSSSSLIDLFCGIAQRIGFDAHQGYKGDAVTIVNAYPPGRTKLQSREKFHGKQTYTGKVYCATTSTGLLAVRGNADEFGFVCGNTSPIEMCEVKLHLRLPIFIMRQLVRHRTACLTGDTTITFDEPASLSKGKRKARHMTVEEIFQRFQPTKGEQGNPFFKRDRVRTMHLRSCNEETLEPYHTRIVDIWQNGIKAVLKVEFPHGHVLRATADHRCFTDQGWLPLGEALQRDAKFASFQRATGIISEPIPYTDAELHSEQWTSIVDYPGYEVSTLGRVRSFSNFRWGLRDTPVIKSPTINENGYHVVSLSRDGVSRAFLVHRLMREAFQSPGPMDETRHLDNNRLNNRIGNLGLGTTVDNAKDRMEFGCDQKLSVQFISPLAWHEDGTDMTYDLSVEGPFHNFSAGNVVVHNSLNEYSARYSVMSDEFYVPDAAVIQPQSRDNKQGRAGAISEVSRQGVQWLMETIGEQAYDVYRVLLGEREGRDPNFPEEVIYDPYSEYEPLLDAEFPGIAREVARTVLPVSYYTEVYWKQNLHNLLHLLKLRTDNHAQYEIRVYANAIYQLVKPLFPIACEAWEDYDRDAVTLSRMEVNLCNDLLHHRVQIEQVDPGDYGMSKREMSEFIARFDLAK